jgi:EH domain-containing protein 1
LKKLYIEKLKPLEVTYRFNDFVSPTLVLSYCFLFKFSFRYCESLNDWVMQDVNLLVDVIIARVMQTESDFDAKPQVMLLGQYSTGKTTFIKHLLRTSYPGAHIGPEPTTDRFVVVMVGASSLQEIALRYIFEVIAVFGNDTNTCSLHAYVHEVLATSVTPVLNT